MTLKGILSKLIPSLRARDAVNSLITDKTGSILSEIHCVEGMLHAMDEKNEYLFFSLQRNEGESSLESRKRIIASLPQSYGKTRGIQLISSFILQRVYAICKSKHIEYSLAYGSLLGAIRHNGFIPWDDDLDIMINYDDLSLLLESVNSDDMLTMKRYYWCGDSECNGARYYYKVKLKGCEFAFVDVFIYSFMDYGYSYETWENTRKLSDSFHKELQIIMQTCGFTSPALRPEADARLDDYVSMLEVKYHDEFTKQFASDDKRIGFTVSINTLNMNREGLLIKETRKYLPIQNDCVEFEGQTYCSFGNPEMMLRELYGDYYSLPFNVSQTHISEFEDVTLESVTSVLDDLGIVNDVV